MKITGYPSNENIVITRCSAIAERPRCRVRLFGPKVGDWIGMEDNIFRTL